MKHPHHSPHHHIQFCSVWLTGWPSEGHKPAERPPAQSSINMEHTHTQLLGHLTIDHAWIGRSTTFPPTKTAHVIPSSTLTPYSISSFLPSSRFRFGRSMSSSAPGLLLDEQQRGRGRQPQLPQRTLQLRRHEAAPREGDRLASARREGAVG